jgi:hypothetical protein
MAVRKFWLVMPLIGASNSPELAEDIRAERPSRNVRSQGGIRLDRSQLPEHYYTSEADAVTACEQKARLNPLVPYTVMAIHTIRETATPTVITKRFTDDGELVLA